MKRSVRRASLRAGRDCSNGVAAMFSGTRRRDLLAGLSSTVALSGLGGCASTANRRASVFRDYPFTLGVASGSPTESAIVLWTRLAPQPLQPDGGMDHAGVPVHWELSRSPHFADIIANGIVVAKHQRAHSVHVDVRGLSPSTRYWYRFFVGDIASPVGATRTLPGLIEAVAQARFATVSCQNYTHGYFTAYDGLVQQQPDFVLHLGDYIYETSFGGAVRSHGTENAPRTLEAFRQRHALYKLDPWLAHAHATAPFFVTLDNHDAVEDARSASRAVRMAAYRAWREHMPVRDFLDDSGGARIAQSINLGSLARIEVPDTRQFRDRQDVCSESADPAQGFGLYRSPCPEMASMERSLLGQTQEDALLRRLQSPAPTWTAVASTVPFAQFAMRADEGRRIYIGSWNGYPESQARLSAVLAGLRDTNVVVLSGDVHSTWIMDLQRKRGNTDTTFGSEIVTTSVTSPWPQPLAKPMTESLTFNTHVRFHDVERRGFVMHDLTHDAWRSDLVFVSDVTTPQAEMRIGKSVTIKAGTPGVADIS